MADKKNPFTTLWNLIGTTGGIIGLSSMFQNWSNDLLQWKGFIADLIDGYRGVLEPTVDFLFGWLPFNVPYWVGDYLLIGSIVAASWVKSYLPLRRSTYEQTAQLTENMAKAMVLRIWAAKHLRFGNRHRRSHAVLLLLTVLRHLLLWPYSIFRESYRYVELRKQTSAYERGVPPSATDFWLYFNIDVIRWTAMWTGAVLLGFVVLVAVNVYILTP